MYYDFSCQIQFSSILIYLLNKYLKAKKWHDMEVYSVSLLVWVACEEEIIYDPNFANTSTFKNKVNKSKKIVIVKIFWKEM